MITEGDTIHVCVIIKAENEEEPVQFEFTVNISSNDFGI